MTSKTARFIGFAMGNLLFLVAMLTIGQVLHWRPTISLLVYAGLTFISMVRLIRLNRARR